MQYTDISKSNTAWISNYLSFNLISFRYLKVFFFSFVVIDEYQDVLIDDNAQWEAM